MERKSKKMLNEILKNNELNEGVNIYDLFVDEYVKSNRLSVPATVACLKYLEQNGYISVMPSKIDNTPIMFYLTHKGRYRMAVGWEELSAFLLKSILVPIFVTLATLIAKNLLLAHIPELLQYLLQ